MTKRMRQTLKESLMKKKSMRSASYQFHLHLHVLIFDMLLYRQDSDTKDVLLGVCLLTTAGIHCSFCLKLPFH